MLKQTWRVAVPAILALVLLPTGCPRPTPAVEEAAGAPGVEVEEVPPPDELLRRAMRLYEERQLADAAKTVGKILVTQPHHLEARVLRAAVAEAAAEAKEAAEAWTEVERILVYKGKLAPFSLQPTLYAAARYYVEADRMDRARLFLDELWRRFPSGEWGVKARLMLAENQYSRGRWTRVVSTCGGLRRVQPGHRLLRRCDELVLTARRMLEVGPEPGPDAQPWTWEHPLPQGNPLNDIWVGPDGVLVAVGEAGTVLQRRSGKGRPMLVDSGTRWSLRGVWGTAPDSIYAVGAAGVVVHFDGKSWRVIRKPRPAAADLWSAFSAAPGHLIAVGDNGTVVTLDGGRWVESRPATVTLRGVWGPGPGEAYAAGDGGLLLRLVAGEWQTVRSDSYEDLWSVWGGGNGVFVVGNRKTVVRVDVDKAKESVVGRGHFRDAWGFGASRVWSVGTRGEVIHFDGKRWRSEATGCLVDLFGVAGTSPADLWAVGDGGTMLRRRGQRWVKSSGGLQQDLIALTLGPAAGQGHALGAQGMLMRRSRGGRWRQAGSLPLLGRYTDLWSNGSRWVAVGTRGLMVVRDSNGKWKQVTTDTPEDLLAVWGYDGGAAAVGTRGTIVRLVGDRVVRDRPPTGLDLRDVWGDGKQLYVVGNRGVVLRLEGEQWTELDTGVLSDLHGVWGVPGARVFAVGEDGLVLELADGRFTRHATPIAQTLVDIWGNAEDAVFAVSRQGGIIRHDGKRWQVQRSPAACLTAVFGDPATGVLAVGCHGTVLRWTP